MKNWRSERGKRGELPNNLSGMPKRVRHVLESVNAQLQGAVQLQRDLAAEAKKIRADAHLSDEGKKAQIEAVRAQRLAPFRGVLEKARAFVSTGIEQIEADVQHHLNKDPLGPLPTLPDGASLEARLTRQAIATTRSLLVEQRRARIEADVDLAMHRDPTGGELQRIAALALEGADPLDAHLWETAAPARLRRFGGTANAVLDFLVADARERRVAQIPDQALLEELDRGEMLSTAQTFAKLVGEAIERPNFVDKGAEEIGHLAMGFGALGIIWDEDSNAA